MNIYRKGSFNYDKKISDYITPEESQWEQWNVYIEDKVKQLAGAPSRNTTVSSNNINKKDKSADMATSNKGYVDETREGRVSAPVNNTNKNIIKQAEIEMKPKLSMTQAMFDTLQSFNGGVSTIQSHRISMKYEVDADNSQRAPNERHNEESKEVEEAEEDDSKIGFFGASTGANGSSSNDHSISNKQIVSNINSARPISANTSTKKKLPPQLDLDKIAVAPKHIRPPSASGAGAPSAPSNGVHMSPPPSTKVPLSVDTSKSSDVVNQSSALTGANMLKRKPLRIAVSKYPVKYY